MLRIGKRLGSVPYCAITERAEDSGGRATCTTEGPPVGLTRGCRLKEDSAPNPPGGPSEREVLPEQLLGQSA